MKKLLTAIMLVMFTVPAYAEAEFVAKPIWCDSHRGDRGSLFKTFKEDGLAPLMGMVGQTWTHEGEMIPADFYVFYDPDDGQWAIIEQDAQVICLIAAGTVVEFDPTVLKDLLDW